MKLLKQITFFFTAIILLTIAACKKYPDGPLISFQTKMYRLTNTNWDVDSFIANGHDSTAYLKSQLFYGNYYFRKPESDNNGRFAYHPLYNSNCDGSGQWEFTNNKKSIIISAIYSTFGHIGPFRLDDSIAKVTWDIMRLTQKDLWLKTTYNGKEYFVKFK